MPKRILVAALVASLCSIAVQAAPKRFGPERQLEVARDTALRVGRLFELSRLTAPICSDRLIWGSGPVRYFVLPESPKSASFEQGRQLVMREFGARPGEFVWLADPMHTPDAKAGIKRGDREQPRPSATEKSEADAALSLQERADKARRASNERASLEPIRKREILRGEQVLTLEIESVPNCPFGFELLDSENRYAGAAYATVLLTRPMLTAIDERDLVMVLAHEASQILLGFTELRDKNRLVQSGLNLLLGSGGSNSANPELGKNSLDEDSLAEIDKLTAVLIDVYGISPVDYKRFLERQQTEASFFRPTYVSTRRVTKKRLEALGALDAQHRKDGSWSRPWQLDDEQFDALVRHIEQAKRDGLVAPLAAKKAAP